MTFNKTLLGSVTIWYNPDPLFIENVKTYSEYPEWLIIVDNSLYNNQLLFDKIYKENKVYIWNGDNMGIAKALNQGIAMLMDKDIKFALTLDQDSYFEAQEIEKLLAAAQNLNWENVGILSPIHVQQKSVPVYNADEYTPALCVMTSGNILNLEIAKEAGFFKEQLFIDHVDNEYCLRLNSSGHKVLVANSFLRHELGRYIDAHIFGKRVGGFISHSPDRLYYFVRNSLYILKKYYSIDAKYTLMEITSLLKRFFKLFFEDNTRKRLSLYLKGIRDRNKL